MLLREFSWKTLRKLIFFQSYQYFDFQLLLLCGNFRLETQESPIKDSFFTNGRIVFVKECDNKCSKCVSSWSCCDNKERERGGSSSWLSCGLLFPIDIRFPCSQKLFIFSAIYRYLIVLHKLAAKSVLQRMWSPLFWGQYV